MPIYEYECETCAHVFEKTQKGYEEKQPNCPVCGKKSRRLVSGTTFVLKGGGWAESGYSNK